MCMDEKSIPLQIHRCNKMFYALGNIFKEGKVRTPYKDASGEVISHRTLTEEQENAVSEISPFIKSKSIRFLVHGVTSSGKTEIYIK